MRYHNDKDQVVKIPRDVEAGRECYMSGSKNSKINKKGGNNNSAKSDKLPLNNANLFVFETHNHIHSSTFVFLIKKINETKNKTKLRTKKPLPLANAED